MKRIAVFVIFTFYFLLFTLPVNASYISLNTALTSKYQAGKLAVSVTIINKGDEPAHNVQAEFRAGGKRVLADKVPSLPQTWTYRASRDLSLGLTKPGTYPLTLIVHYTDANQYPFSALSLQTYVNRQETPSPLVGRLDSATFDKEGRLNLKLKNSGERPVRATVKLVVPAELTVEQDGRTLDVGPGSGQSVTFSLKNFSALNGSSYQVFAVAEFEDGGLHHAAISPGLIKISAQPGVLGLAPWLAAAVLAVLALIFAAAQFLRKK